MFGAQEAEEVVVAKHMKREEMLRLERRAKRFSALALMASIARKGSLRSTSVLLPPSLYLLVR